MDIGAFEEAIVVTGGAPLLDTATALKKTAISRQELDALSNGTDVWFIARVVSGIVMDKVDVVLHAFEKRTRRPAQPDIALASEEASR